MNFDFTDDQQAIKRTANEMLAARFKPERVRELSEAGSYDDEAWKEMSELGWPGIFIDEDHGGQGLGVVELVIEAELLRLNSWRGLTQIMKRGVPGPEGSLPKWQWGEIHQSLTELAVDILGEDGAAWDSPWTYRLLRSRANSIEGGTTEILKNIIAERVLGLPKLR